MRAHRIKVINSNYDCDTGISNVTIRTRHGDFTGYAYLHPDDITRGSRFFGCEIAELRAQIKYFKTVKNILRLQCEALQEYYSNMMSYTKTSENSKEAIYARVRIESYKNELTDCREKIRYLEREIQQRIVNYDMAMNRLDHFFTRIDRSISKKS